MTEKTQHSPTYNVKQKWKGKSSRKIVGEKSLGAIDLSSESDSLVRTILRMECEHLIHVCPSRLPEFAQLPRERKEVRQEMQDEGNRNLKRNMTRERKERTKERQGIDLLVSLHFGTTWTSPITVWVSGKNTCFEILG